MDSARTPLYARRMPMQSEEQGTSWLSNNATLLGSLVGSALALVVAWITGGLRVVISHIRPYRMQVLDASFTYPGHNALVADVSARVLLWPKIRTSVKEASISVPTWKYSSGQREIPLSSSFAKGRKFHPTDNLNEVVRVQVPVARTASSLEGDRKEFKACIERNGIEIILKVADGWFKVWKAKIRVVKDNYKTSQLPNEDAENYSPKTQ